MVDEFYEILENLYKTSLSFDILTLKLINIFRFYNLVVEYMSCFFIEEHFYMPEFLREVFAIVVVLNPE